MRLIMSRLIDLTPVVTKFFVTGITVEEYKIGRYDTILCIDIKRHIDMFEISKHH